MASLNLGDATPPPGTQPALRPPTSVRSPAASKRSAPSAAGTIQHANPLQMLLARGPPSPSCCAMVPCDGDDASSACSGSAPRSSSEQNSSGSDVAPRAADGKRYVVCIRCEEEEDWNEAGPYGRTPFTRVCKKCCSAYKGRCELIKKQKERGGGKSEMETWWKGLTPEGQKAWYLKQKRGSQMAHQRRDWSHTVEIGSSSSDGVQKGRQRQNRLVNWDLFWDKARSQGKTQEDAATEWREKLLNPNIAREQHLIDGKMQTCIELFEGILRYSDEFENTVFRQSKARKCDSAADVGEALKEQTVEWNRVLAGHEFSVDVHAPTMKAPCDYERLDLQVENHRLPAPVPVEMFIPGPSHARPYCDQLMRDLRSAEKTSHEVEEEMNAEAREAAKGQTRKQAAQSKRDVKLAEKKTIIAAKASAEGQSLGIKTRFETLENDALLIAENLMSYLALLFHL